jgi:peroxiredoxin
VGFLAINSNGHWDVAKNKQWHDGAEVPYSVLVDQSGEVGKAYGAKTTPHMFILNADHEIVYEGAIDDDVGGEKADPVNYVDKALAQLTADEELTVADTKPYGCSVKYKK